MIEKPPPRSSGIHLADRSDSEIQLADVHSSPRRVFHKGDLDTLHSSYLSLSPPTIYMASVQPPPRSPGVGARRKGPKVLPRLPLSAFTPPNSGTSDRFPLPPSPSTVHPAKVVDANVISSISGLTAWNSEVGQVLGGRIGGVVLSLRGSSPDAVRETLASSVSLSYPIG